MVGDRASPTVLTLVSSQTPTCRDSGNQTWHLGQASGWGILLVSYLILQNLQQCYYYLRFIRLYHISGKMLSCNVIMTL